ncbi:GIY-YIG nuclease family protein [Solitalea agri]|uniref:GIY-YIG nuclease family protein n=1 Tax=Solitalea TaxID=929509 RepID=UPI003623B834
MPFYIYILKSRKDGSFYKGFTEDYCKRLEEHNLGLSQFTSTKTPWELIYVEEHANKQSALIRERKLKKCKKEYFEWLCKQPTNILIKG